MNGEERGHGGALSMRFRVGCLRKTAGLREGPRLHYRASDRWTYLPERRAEGRRPWACLGFMCYQPHVPGPIGSNLHLLSLMASNKLV